MKRKRFSDKRIKEILKHTKEFLTVCNMECRCQETEWQNFCDACKSYYKITEKLEDLGISIELLS